MSQELPNNNQKTIKCPWIKFPFKKPACVLKMWKISKTRDTETYRREAFSYF